MCVAAVSDDCLLVGAGEERRRNLKTNRFGGLEADDQFELRRLFDRQVLWLGSAQDLDPIAAQEPNFMLINGKNSPSRGRVFKKAALEYYVMRDRPAWRRRHSTHLTESQEA